MGVFDDIQAGLGKGFDAAMDAAGKGFDAAASATNKALVTRAPFIQAFIHLWDMTAPAARLARAQRVATSPTV